MAKEIKDLPSALERIADLESQISAATTPAPLSAREKEIQRRMREGRISRVAAELATEHQFDNDARLARESGIEKLMNQRKLSRADATALFDSQAAPAERAA